MRVLLFLSATEFSCGVCGVFGEIAIAFSPSSCIIALVRYSFALSHRTRAMGIFRCFCTVAMAPRTLVGTSLLVFSKYTIFNIVCSSVAVMKYVWPTSVFANGPAKSVTIVCPGGGLSLCSFCGAQVENARRRSLGSELEVEFLAGCSVDLCCAWVVLCSVFLSF